MFLEILFFLLMLLLIGIPFIPGLFELFRPKDDAPLTIDLESSSDPRQPALQLAAQLKAKSETFEILQLVKGAYPPTFSTQGITVEEGCHIDSLCGESSIILKEGSAIKQMIDAKNELRIEKGCDLGLIASSAEMISLSPKCTFKRLYAPKIVCMGSESAPHANLSPIDIGHFGWYVNHKKFIIPPEATIKNNIYSSVNLKIRHKAVIEGSIQCQGKVFISDSVIIKGNIFAKESVVIGRQCQILGNIFSQSSVVIHSGSVVGEMGKIKSVIGKDKIKLHGGTTIYGHVMTQGKGYVI